MGKEGDVTVNYHPRNVDKGVRTINFWGRIVWDKGPVIQLRLPPFEGAEQSILELMCRRPWIRRAVYWDERKDERSIDFTDWY